MNCKLFIINNIIRILLILDNYIHSKISKFSVKFENGLHPKHRLTKYHQFFLDNVSRNDLVLDIGCGNGYNTHKISEKALSVVGIDIDKENIILARKRFFRSNIEYIQGDATEYLFDKKFNVIILSNVLEHINDRISFLKKIKQLSNKFLIRVPIMNRDWLVLYKKEFKIEYRLDKTHYIEYTIEDLTTEIKKAGLKINNYSVQFGEIWAVVNCQLKH